MNESITELCYILNKYGSDKSPLTSGNRHNYSKIYFEMFKELKDKPINLFEVGILNGSSLRGWAEFFKNGNVYAADFDKNRLINQNNIKSFYCNQDDINSIKQMWEKDELKNIMFDIIIDDGKHEHTANLNFLISSFFKLKQDGVFIIEDLDEDNCYKFKNIENQLKDNYGMIINLLDMPLESNKIDNRLLIIKKG